MSGLRIARGFALPVDVAGEAIAILAKRGAGKTNTGRVLVEELHGANVQTIVLDPVGAWWGLRSSADGKKDGLPLPVLGGAHGDVPLQAAAGALLADVVVDTGQSLVLDLSDFSKTEQRRFVTASRIRTRSSRPRSGFQIQACSTRSRTTDSRTPGTASYGATRPTPIFARGLRRRPSSSGRCAARRS